jgi:hypothetical protein
LREPGVLASSAVTLRYSGLRPKSVQHGKSQITHVEAARVLLAVVFYLNPFRNDEKELSCRAIIYFWSRDLRKRGTEYGSVPDL